MSLLRLPPDTEKMRKLFFDMPVPFSVRADVVDRYWPISDNFWSRYNEITLKGTDDVPYNVIRWFCRLAPRDPEKELKEGQTPPVKRPKKEIYNCSCRIKAFVYRNVEGQPDHYQFEHANAKEADWQHGHTQEDADKHRLNSFLKGAVSIEVARGYAAAEAYKNLRSIKLKDAEPWNTQSGEQTELALVAAGGKYMTRQHIIDNRNALRRSSEPNRIDKHAEITGTDTANIWPVGLGRDEEDYDAHAEVIKAEVAALITSVDLGGRTEVPSRILMPLLNSLAAFLEKQNAVPEKEKPVLPVSVDVASSPIPNQTPTTPVEANPSSMNPSHSPQPPYPYYPPQNQPSFSPYASQPPPYPPFPPNKQHPSYQPHSSYPHANQPPAPGPNYQPPPSIYSQYPPPGPSPMYRPPPPSHHIHPPPPPNYAHYQTPPGHPNQPPPPPPPNHSPRLPLQPSGPNSQAIAPREGAPMTPVSTGNEDENKKSNIGEESAVQEAATDRNASKKRKRKRKKKGEPPSPVTYRYVFEHCGS